MFGKYTLRVSKNSASPSGRFTLVSMLKKSDDQDTECTCILKANLRLGYVPEEVPKVIARVKTEPLDVIKEDNARDKEDLGKVNSFDSLPLMAFKLDARILHKSRHNNQFPYTLTFDQHLQKFNTVLCIHVL